MVLDTPHALFSEQQTPGKLDSPFRQKPVPPAATQPGTGTTSLKGTCFYQQSLTDWVTFNSAVLKAACPDAVEDMMYKET